VTAAIVQGGLLGRLVKKFGEERLALLAIGTNVIVQMCYGLAWEGWMMYAILVASFLISTAGPCIQAIVSKSASPSEQGILLGSLQSIMALSAVLGPATGNVVLAQVVELPPSGFLFGSTFFLGAIVNSVAFVLAWQRLYGAKRTAGTV
jgi:DHA1 family tetracycline resistance protein-like MFS transporter